MNFKGEQKTLKMKLAQRFDRTFIAINKSVRKYKAEMESLELDIANLISEIEVLKNKK